MIHAYRLQRMEAKSGISSEKLAASRRGAGITDGDGTVVSPHRSKRSECVHNEPRSPQHTDPLEENHDQ